MDIDRDRASVTALLASRPDAKSRLEPNLGFIDPVTAVQAALAVAQLLHLGGPSRGKEEHKQWEAASRQVVAATGPDILAASQMMSLNPQGVAAATSDYLADKGIHLTASQLLAESNATVTGKLAANMPVIVLGAGGLFLLFLMRR